jgi:hypothetical protein
MDLKSAIKRGFGMLTWQKNHVSGMAEMVVCLSLAALAKPFAGIDNRLLLPG